MGELVKIWLVGRPSNPPVRVSRHHELPKTLSASFWRSKPHKMICYTIPQSAERPTHRSDSQASFYSWSGSVERWSLKSWVWECFLKNTLLVMIERLSYIGTVILSWEVIQIHLAQRFSGKNLPFGLCLLPSTTLKSNLSWVYWEMADVWSASKSKCTCLISWTHA